MADRPRNSAGVTMAPGSGRGKSVALLALAVSLACVALLVLFGRPTGQLPAPAARPPEPEGAPAAAGPAAERPAHAPAASEPTLAPEPEEAPAREPAPPAAAEEPGPEDAPSVPSGIGLFPPPGTDPIKIGIVVPDDYELPEGYLRHHQVTDDGQELEPILLFHPDYELLDDAGRPIALPENRVVPPELAPPGLPIRMLEVPPPREETGP
jgi:hypothetical protein